MLLVKKLNGKLIVEDALRLLKRNAMLLQVCDGLRLIPLEIYHAYSVCKKIGKSRSAAILVVGHQPALGYTAALLLAGSEADWSIKKGAGWWFSNRTRDGEAQTVLRAVVPAELT